MKDLSFKQMLLPMSIIYGADMLSTFVALNVGKGLTEGKSAIINNIVLTIKSL